MEAQLVRQIVRPFGVRLSDTTGLSEIPLDRVNTAPLREVGESNKLVLLTDTRSGLPTLADAMDPANFPFVESARMAKPMNWGIVKLKNVRCNLSFTPLSLYYPLFSPPFLSFGDIKRGFFANIAT